MNPYGIRKFIDFRIPDVLKQLLLADYFICMAHQVLKNTEFLSAKVDPSTRLPHNVLDRIERNVSDSK